MVKKGAYGQNIKLRDICFFLRISLAAGRPALIRRTEETTGGGESRKPHRVFVSFKRPPRQRTGQSKTLREAASEGANHAAACLAPNGLRKGRQSTKKATEAAAKPKSVALVFALAPDAGMKREPNSFSAECQPPADGGFYARRKSAEKSAYDLALNGIRAMSAKRLSMSSLLAVGPTQKRTTQPFFVMPHGSKR